MQKKYFFCHFGCWLLPEKFSFCPKNNSFVRVWGCSPLSPNPLPRTPMGLGLLDIGLGEVESRTMDACASLSQRHVILHNYWWHVCETAKHVWMYMYYGSGTGERFLICAEQTLRVHWPDAAHHHHLLHGATICRKSPRLCRFKSDRDELWHDCSLRDYTSSDGVGFSIWHRTFKMVAMTSFHAEKCYHLEMKTKRMPNAASASYWSIDIRSCFQTHCTVL